nr:MAP/microtubule affinity-regulating kinase 3 [Polyrhizophydium stewartii]
MAEAESLYSRTVTERANKPKAASIGYYDLEKNIGEGNFAKVKLATHILTGQKVAVKIIDKNKLDKTTAKKLFREVRIMKLLNHKNIVRLYEVIDTPDELYLIMEYVSGGEIFDYLVAHGRMKEKEARKHFRDIVSALAYCHSMHIIHRDLKAENLLLDENMNVKVADFGFSNQYSPGQRLNTWCGSPPYAAPELFQGKEYVGPEVDVWSMGVVLYVLVCGSLPFDGSNLAKLRARVISGKFKIPFYMSPDCERLIKKMLVIDPAKRSSLEQVMQDKWFTEGYENEKLDSSSGSGSSAAGAAFTLTSEQHQSVLDELEEIGLDRKAVEKSLADGEYDPLAATYYLVADKRYRQKQLDALPSALAASPFGGGAAEGKKPSTAAAAAKSSRGTELSGINEEGDAGDGAAEERQRRATEPPLGSTAPSGAAASPPRVHEPARAAGAAGAGGGASGGAGAGGSGAARPPSSTVIAGHRRRATFTAAPAAASEMRKEFQAEAAGVGAGTASPSGMGAGLPSGTGPGSPSGTGAGPNMSGTGSGDGMRELPPPRVSGRAPSARTREALIASEFKQRPAEPALAQTAAVPPGAPQLLPPIPAAPRARAHTLAAGTARPAAQGDDDEPIPLDQLRRRLDQDADGPRTARFTFSLNTTSTKEPDLVFAEVVRVLKEAGVRHTVTGLVATCDLDGIEFELEVCRLPNLPVNGLRFKRLAGNTWEYKDVITGLISKMNL